MSSEVFFLVGTGGMFFMALVTVFTIYQHGKVIRARNQQIALLKREKPAPLPPVQSSMNQLEKQIGELDENQKSALSATFRKLKRLLTEIGVIGSDRL